MRYANDAQPRMNISCFRVFLLVVGVLLLTGCEAIVVTFELLEAAGELYELIRDYPWFSLGVVVGVLVWGALRYLFSGKETRGHGEETKGQDRVSEKRLDELNGEKCPHCGKRKKGLADHIAAMHPEYSGEKSNKNS